MKHSITVFLPYMHISSYFSFIFQLKVNGFHICQPSKCWELSRDSVGLLNTLRPRQDGRHFPDDIFKCIFLNGNTRMSLKKSLNFVPKVRINNIPALDQIMAWRRPGDKPLSEPMMVCLLTHICVTRPQWFKWYCLFSKTHSWLYILKGTNHQNDYDKTGISYMGPVGTILTSQDIKAHMQV